jgi:hypothetical protein
MGVEIAKGGNMPMSKGCIELQNFVDYLENNAFTDVEFMGSENGRYYFSALDEDDKKKEVLFEHEDNGMWVYVRENQSEPFHVFAKLDDDTCF